MIIKPKQLNNILLSLFENQEPIFTDTHLDVSINTLLQHTDVGMYFTAIHSFYLHSGFIPSLRVWDDGTLTEADVKFLTSKINGIHIVSSKDFNEKVNFLIKSYNLDGIMEFGNMTKKLFIPNLVGEGKLLMMDSDILFFQKPEEILKWLNSSDKEKIRYNAELDYRTPGSKIRGGKYLPRRVLENGEFTGLLYKEELLELSKLVKEPVYYAPDFNAGFMAVPSGFIDMNFLSKLYGAIRKLGYLPGELTPVMEQTLNCLLLGKHGSYEKLPPEYFCFSSPKPSSYIMRHYIGDTKFKTEKYLSEVIKLAGSMNS